MLYHSRWQVCVCVCMWWGQRTDMYNYREGDMEWQSTQTSPFWPELSDMKEPVVEGIDLSTTAIIFMRAAVASWN